MYFTYISDGCCDNQYFETLEEAQHNMTHWGCRETPFSYDSEQMVDDTYRPCHVTCYVNENDLPNDFDDLPEDEQDRVLDKLVGDGAYCPSISEFEGPLSRYFD